MEDYEKTHVDALVKYGCVARAKLGMANIRRRWVGAILLGLISGDKNGVEDITFTLSRGTIDDFCHRQRTCLMNLHPD